MEFLPINIRINTRNILIIGGGKVAAHKAAILSRFTGQVTVLAPQFHETFRELPFRLLCKSYEKGDISGYQLIYICTDNHALNKEIKEEAGRAGIPASVCDAPHLCDFTSPAIYRRENLTISIATDGKEVKRAIAIRNRIQELIEAGILVLD
ncbi:MAG: bifunctional precorrin-2 dehydrogenase/sirohydrochlorin ferrochelatase [Tannerellaceae bacterium]|nr:bifunctional precorrin-2 dehydrogenase/sirohydrochlorin ferrochelatase [Tannerellaceae bacterium]